MAPRKVPAEERFLKFVIKTPTCWLWVGGTSTSGYGKFGDRSTSVYAHRWAYERWVGPIPAELQIDHLCRVKLCVNPAHMEPVTGIENRRRGRNHYRDRTHCKYGHPFAGENLRVRRDTAGRIIGRRCHACSMEATRRHKERARRA